MLKDHVNVIVGVLQEEESEGSVNAGLSLPSWYDPDLRLNMLVVQVGECGGNQLNVVQLHSNLREYAAYPWCMIFHQLEFSLQV